jgi:hypothetical protein
LAEDAETAPAFFEPDSSRPADPVAAAVSCVEQRARALLLDGLALSAAFFDLSTGVAGELMQKLTNYDIRMAGVVPDLLAQSPRFREFVREANAGTQVRFFTTRQEAKAWLESL